MEIKIRDISVGVRICSAVLCLLLAVAFWRFSEVTTYILQYLSDMKSGQSTLGLVVFFACYTVLVTILFPTLPLNVLAGFIWGGVLGGFMSTVAVTSGSFLSFMLARTALRETFQKVKRPVWLLALEKNLESNKWIYLAFIRLNPIFPTGPINYMLGLTKLGALPFILLTFFPIMVPSTLFSFLGSFLGDFGVETIGDTKDFLAIVLGLFVVSIFILFFKLLKRAKDDIMSR